MYLHKYSEDSIISTVSIKRTVGNISLMTLLNVQYNLHIGSCIDKRTVSIKRTVWISPYFLIIMDNFYIIKYCHIMKIRYLSTF